MWSANTTAPPQPQPPSPAPKPASVLHSKLSIDREKRLAIVMAGAKKRIDSGKIDSDKKLDKWLSAAKDTSERQAFKKFHTEMNSIRKEDGKFNKDGYSKFFDKYEKEFRGKK